MCPFQDLSDDFVSSSSSSQTESKFVNAGVQTQVKGKRDSASAAKQPTASTSGIIPPGFISEKDLKDIVEKVRFENNVYVLYRMTDFLKI